MKKIYILITAFVILIPLVYSECTDTDGGKDYSIKGIGKLEQQHEDECKYEKLLEHYCDGSGILKKNEYFFVTASGIDRLLRYKGSDKCSDSNPIAKFDNVETGERHEASIVSDSTFTLNLYGDSLSFSVLDCSIDDSDVKLLDKSYLMQERYECPNSCNDGACVDSNFIEEDIGEFKYEKKNDINQGSGFTCRRL